MFQEARKCAHSLLHQLLSDINWPRRVPYRHRNKEQARKKMMLKLILLMNISAMSAVRFFMNLDNLPGLDENGDVSLFSLEAKLAF